MTDEIVATPSPEPAEVAAHTIILRRGTYCIHVVSTAAEVAPAQLPGLAISAAPGEENTAVEIARLRGEPWLREPGDAVLIRVHAEQVRLLLTSYNTLRLRGATPPKVEIQRLGAASPPIIEQAREIPSDITVHVRNKGDQRGSLGEWVGERKKNFWIEGYTIKTPAGLESSDLEYQAVFGKGWSSPWVHGGEYCGSRGLQLPILGLRLRLNNGLEKRLQIELEAAFADGATFGPVPAGTVCATEPLQPVTAIRVSVRPKAARAVQPASADASDGTAQTRAAWRRSKK